MNPEHLDIDIADDERHRNLLLGRQRPARTLPHDWEDWQRSPGNEPTLAPDERRPH